MNVKSQQCMHSYICLKTTQINRSWLCIVLIIDDVLKGEIFWSQMSNIFGARLNHTVNKTLIKPFICWALLCCCYMRGTNSLTLFSVHSIVASSESQTCAMLSRSIDEKSMQSWTNHCSLPAFLSVGVHLILEEIWSILWICEHVSNTCIHHSELKNQRKSSLSETATWPKAVAYLRVIQNKWRLHMLHLRRALWRFCKHI